MWGGFSWASGAWASQPQYGESHPGMVLCEDDTIMFAYGGDMADEGIAFGGVSTGGGSVSGGGSVRGGGYVSGGDSTTGTVSGGDERAG